MSLEYPPMDPESDDPNDSPPVLFLGQQEHATSPRVLVRTVLLTPGAEAIDHTAYAAMQPNGVVDDADGMYQRDVIGFAEFPKNQPVGRSHDRDEFKETVEVKSVYVHWKDDEYVRDVEGPSDE